MYKKINFLACCIIAFSFVDTLQAGKKPTPEAAFSFLSKVKDKDLKRLQLSKSEKELLENIRGSKAEKLDDFLNQHTLTGIVDPIKDIEALYYKIKQHKKPLLQKIGSALKRHKVKSLLVVLLLILIRVMRYDIPRIVIFPGTSFCYQEGTEENLAYFTSQDGTKLSYKYAEDDSYTKVLLFLGGNAETAAASDDLVKKLATTFDANVYMLDPRGYGRSQGGWPSSKKQIEGDLERFFEEVIVKKSKNQSLNMFVMGFSMGGAFASSLSRLHDDEIKGTILHSTYTTLQEEINDRIPSWLISFPKLDNISNVKEIKHPILVIHGTNDTVIKFKHGVALAKEVQNGDKNVYRSAKVDHTLSNFPKIKEFMQACISNAS